MRENTTGSVKSADRVLELFELLFRWGRGMSHSEIAEALDIPKSSLTQLIRTMETRGYLRFSPGDKRYYLGQRLTELARQTSHSYNLVDLAKPLLHDITKITSESSALAVREGDMLAIAASVYSPHRLISHMRVGDTAPLYATSGGKAILAFLPPDDQQSYLERTAFEAITPKTILSANEILGQLEQVRKDGVADVFEEYTVGIIGLSVPIFADTDSPIGALNVAIPSVRYSSALRRITVDALKSASQTLRMHLSDKMRLGHRLIIAQPDPD